MDILEKFGKLFDNQGFLDNMIYAIIATASLIGLFIFRVVWKSYVTRKVRRTGVEAGMSMMDIDQMRKKGIINEAEYRRIRGTLAHHEVARTEEQQRIDKERKLIAQIATNPELARELIKPQPGSGAAALKAINPPPLPPAPTPPNQPSRPGALAEPSYPLGDPNDWPDPLSVDEQPTQQSRFGAIEPSRAADVTPPQEAQSKASDLDILLAKGAISKEDYLRLKKIL